MKSARQEKILELIASHDVETQEELLDLLNQSGYRVTQATVSRDIRDLNLVKAAGPDGRQKYAASEKTGRESSVKYRAVFREGFLSADTAGNLLVVKTVSGMAMAVAAALDDMNAPEIVGSIAGDDTVMCAVRTPGEAVRLCDKLRGMVR